MTKNYPKLKTLTDDKIFEFIDINKLNDFEKEYTLFYKSEEKIIFTFKCGCLSKEYKLSSLSAGKTIPKCNEHQRDNIRTLVSSLLNTEKFININETKLTDEDLKQHLSTTNENFIKFHYKCGCINDVQIKTIADKKHTTVCKECKRNKKLSELYDITIDEKNFTITHNKCGIKTKKSNRQQLLVATNNYKCKLCPDNKDMKCNRLNEQKFILALKDKYTIFKNFSFNSPSKTNRITEYKNDELKNAVLNFYQHAHSHNLTSDFFIELNDKVFIIEIDEQNHNQLNGVKQDTTKENIIAMFDEKYHLIRILGSEIESAIENFDEIIAKAIENPKTIIHFDNKTNFYTNREFKIEKYALEDVELSVTRNFYNLLKKEDMINKLFLDI